MLRNSFKSLQMIKKLCFQNFGSVFAAIFFFSFFIIFCFKLLSYNIALN